MNASTQTVTDARHGLAGILEFKPNKNFTSQLDTFYSKLDDYTKNDNFQFAGSGNFTNATVSGGVVSAGTMNNVSLIGKNEGIFDNDTIKSLGWKNTFKMDNGWTAVFDLSHNSAERIERDDEYYEQLANQQSLTMNGLGGTTPALSYGASLTVPALHRAVRNVRLERHYEYGSIRARRAARLRRRPVMRRGRP